MTAPVVAPATWLGAGYSAAANAITMNTNDAGSNKTLVELTDVEAHATTGDIRKVLFAICEAAYAAWIARAADPTEKMLIYRSSSINETTGKITRTYQLVFETDIVSQEVSDESA
jgi:hypothetical protein